MKRITKIWNHIKYYSFYLLLGAMIGSIYTGNINEAILYGVIALITIQK